MTYIISNDQKTVNGRQHDRDLTFYGDLPDSGSSYNAKIEQKTL